MKRFTRKNLPAELARWESWAPIDASGLDDAQRQRVTALTQAIKDYLSFRPVTATLRALSMSIEQLLRALNRCVALAADGRPYGWCGLLKHLRIKPYTRTKPLRLSEAATTTGRAGALGLFFREHPQIQHDLDRYLRTRRLGNDLHESHLTPQAVHKGFLKLCKAAGIAATQWPYTSAHRGRSAIGDYFRAYLDANYEHVVQWRYGTDAQAKARTGTGIPSRVHATLPRDVLELDEHSEHVVGTIAIDTPKGLRYIPIQRTTILLVADRYTGDLLAYDIIFDAACADDVLRTMHRATLPWERRTFTLPGLQYPASFVAPPASAALAACGCTQLLIDNALAHLASEVRARLQHRLGCAVNFGAVKRFERRPLVENIFRLLESCGIMRLSSTTGTVPSDPKRTNPALAAVKQRIRESEIRDLVELLVVKYKTKEGSTNFLASPMGQLEQVLTDKGLGFLPPLLPELATHEPDLNVWLETGSIAGSRERGERPHVVLQGVSHRNSWLAARWDLLGRTVNKYVSTQDVREFSAFLDDGTSLGVLRAPRKWTETPHSLRTRSRVQTAIATGEIQVDPGEDPVRVWMQAKARQALAGAGSDHAPTTTKAATELAHAMHTTDLHTFVLDSTTEDVPDAPRTTRDALDERNIPAPPVSRVLD